MPLLAVAWINSKGTSQLCWGVCCSDETPSRDTLCAWPLASLQRSKVVEGLQCAKLSHKQVGKFLPNVPCSYGVSGHFALLVSGQERSQASGSEGKAAGLQVKGCISH